jgi:polyadenylate-binding protein
MNGLMLENKPLYVALAQRKEVRRATLEALYARRGTMPVYPFGVGMVGPVVQQPMYRGGWQQAPYVQQPMMQRTNRLPYQQVPQQMMPFGNMIPVQRTMNPQAGRGGRGRPMGGRGGAAGPMGGRGGSAAAAAGGRRPAPGQSQQLKYNLNVRNQPQPTAQTTPQTQPEAQIEIDLPPPTAPLDSTTLTKLPEDQRKQHLGERLFPLIGEKQPELAGKITGMLLEMDHSEVLHLLESPQALQEKIDEALNVLNMHAGDQA